MSQPEILHRCPSCGASLRERAMFCPECGKPLNDSELKQSELAVAASPAGAPESGAKQAGATPSTENGSSTSLAPAQSQSDGVGELQPVTSRRRQSLQRASSVARSAIGDTGKRVEKIQNVSTAMFEEATYDPSLRFVLVAAGLFL